MFYSAKGKEIFKVIDWEENHINPFAHTKRTECIKGLDVY